MIGYLRGRRVAWHDFVSTVDVDGIGYEVAVNDARSIAVGIDVVYWTHEHAPQDAPHELYGFEKREDRDMFRRLLNIKGVGPKVAQRIVASGVKPGDFASGIEAQRMAAHQRLTKIRGVGATLAQRIAEEMK